MVYRTFISWNSIAHFVFQFTEDYSTDGKNGIELFYIVFISSSFFKDTSVGISVFTLTALSFDRYTAIVRPVQSFAHGPRSKPAVVASLAFIWILSLALATPALISAELEVALVPVERFSNTFVASANGEEDEEEVEDDRKNITICYPCTHTLPGEATVTVSGIERRLLPSKHGVEVSN